MQALEKKLILNPIFYVTRDIERATSLDLNLSGFYIISNYSDFAKQIAGEKNNIFLIKENEKLDTWQLLQHTSVIEYINKHSQEKKANILVFKNTNQITKICQANNWQLLNPSAKLANKIEEKISQVQWMKELGEYFPKYKILLGKDLIWSGKKFILQFNRSHTGSGTILIESSQQLKKIKEKFPLRQVRIADYIAGPLFTNNNIIWQNKILLGNISYQITGQSPFTNLPFATVGNDWSLPKKILTQQQIKQYQKIAETVGKKMKQDGWQGLYGIDVVLKAKTGKMYLVEINARQPASTSFESELQDRQKINDNKMTTFEAHLASLLGVKYQGEELIKITDGAQLIQRINQGQKINYTVEKNKKLQALKLKIIKYNNSKPNSDYLRLQSQQGVMTKHNYFNQLGNNIISILNS